MKSSPAFALCFVVALTGSFSAFADAFFLDTTFSDPAWLPVAYITSGLGGSTSGVQTNTGGDDYLQVTVANRGNRSGIAAYCHNSTFNYNPAVQGAITNVDYLVLLMAVSSFNITPIAFASPMVRQGGTNFAATALTTTNLAWTPQVASGLAESDFSALYGSNGVINLNLSLHPNFSSSGTPLTFGYMCDLSTPMGGITNSATFAINDVAIVVHAVHQPPSLGIQTIAGVVLNGIVNHTYLVEYTPTAGPQNWQTLTNIVLPASPFTIYDYQSASAWQRYYRATDVTP